MDCDRYALPWLSFLQTTYCELIYFCWRNISCFSLKRIFWMLMAIKLVDWHITYTLCLVTCSLIRPPELVSPHYKEHSCLGWKPGRLREVYLLYQSMVYCSTIGQLITRNWDINPINTDEPAGLFSWLQENTLPMQYNGLTVI